MLETMPSEDLVWMTEAASDIIFTGVVLAERRKTKCAACDAPVHVTCFGRSIAMN